MNRKYLLAFFILIQFGSFVSASWDSGWIPATFNYHDHISGTAYNCAQFTPNYIGSRGWYLDWDHTNGGSFDYPGEPYCTNLAYIVMMDVYNPNIKLNPNSIRGDRTTKKYPFHTAGLVWREQQAYPYAPGVIPYIRYLLGTEFSGWVGNNFYAMMGWPRDENNQRKKGDYYVSISAGYGGEKTKYTYVPPNNRGGDGTRTCGQIYGFGVGEYRGCPQSWEDLVVAVDNDVQIAYDMSDYPVPVETPVAGNYDVYWRSCYLPEPFSFSKTPNDAMAFTLLEDSEYNSVHFYAYRISEEKPTDIPECPSSTSLANPIPGSISCTASCDSVNIQFSYNNNQTINQNIWGSICEGTTATGNTCLEPVWSGVSQAPANSVSDIFEVTAPLSSEDWGTTLTYTLYSQASQSLPSVSNVACDVPPESECGNTKPRTPNVILDKSELSPSESITANISLDAPLDTDGDAVDYNIVWKIKRGENVINEINPYDTIIDTPSGFSNSINFQRTIDSTAFGLSSGFQVDDLIQCIVTPVDKRGLKGDSGKSEFARVVVGCPSIPDVEVKFNEDFFVFGNNASCGISNYEDFENLGLENFNFNISSYVYRINNIVYSDSLSKEGHNLLSLNDFYYDFEDKWITNLYDLNCVVNVDSVCSSETKSNSVIADVINQKPNDFFVELYPLSLKNEGILRAYIGLMPFADPDKELVSYSFKWFYNENEVPAFNKLGVIAAYGFNNIYYGDTNFIDINVINFLNEINKTSFDNGDKITVKVTGCDGLGLCVDSNTYSIYDTNFPPTPPTISINENPLPSEDVICNITTISTDPDTLPENLKYTLIGTLKRIGENDIKITKQFPGNAIEDIIFNSSITEPADIISCSINVSDGTYFIRGNNVETTIQQGNRFPTGKLKATPCIVKVNEIVDFNIFDLSDPEHDEINYTLNYDDGTSLIEGTSTYTPINKYPKIDSQHAYTNPGIYYPKLKIWDYEGETHATQIGIEPYCPDGIIVQEINEGTITNNPYIKDVNIPNIIHKNEQTKINGNIQIENAKEELGMLILFYKETEEQPILIELVSLYQKDYIDLNSGLNLRNHTDLLSDHFFVDSPGTYSIVVKIDSGDRSVDCFNCIYKKVFEVIDETKTSNVPDSNLLMAFIVGIALFGLFNFSKRNV